MSQSKTIRTIRGIHVSTRDGTCDGSIAYSCIQNDEYKLLRIAEKGKTFIDLGAYCGHACLLAASLGMKCVAIEPLPENVTMILENIDLNGFRDLIKVIPASIGSRPIFWDYKDNDSCKLHKYVGNANAVKTDTNEVHQSTPITLSELIYPYNEVHIVKADCEGGEWEAFSESVDTNNKIKYIVGELHLIDGRRFPEFRSLFPNHNDISADFGYASPDEMRNFAFKKS